MTKPEYLLLSSFRKSKHLINAVLEKTNSLFKLKITRKLLLVFTFFFASIGIFVVCKSRSFKKEGELFYKNIKYDQALEKYYEAKQWWLFERISPKLKDNDLEEKIQKAKVMVHSSELYNEGKKAYEEKRYSSAKWYFSNLAENDPRNEEAKEILVTIEKLLSAEQARSNTHSDTAKPLTFVPTPTSLLPTPTRIDWEQFDKELDESLKNIEPSYTYTYDSYYPIILSFSDNYGQINKNSAFNKYPYSSLPDVTVKIGDIIRCKVLASEPKSRQIYYYFFSNSISFNKKVSVDENNKQKFISNSEIEYTITEEDLKSVGGQRFEIHAAIKSDKEYLRIPSQGYDDTIELHYKILIPED